MAFLTLNGTAYPVSTDNARAEASEFVGESARAFAGNLRTTRRAEKRTWSFSLARLTTAQVDTLRTLCLGGYLTLSGDCVNNVGVSVEATITSAEYRRVGVAASHVRMPALQLREV